MSRWEVYSLFVLALLMYLPLSAQVKQLRKELMALRGDVNELKARAERADLHEQLEVERAKGAEIAARLKREGFYDGEGKWYPPGSEFPT